MYPDRTSTVVSGSWNSPPSWNRRIQNSWISASVWYRPRWKMIDHSRYRVASAHDRTTAASSRPIRDGRDMGVFQQMGRELDPALRRRGLLRSPLPSLAPVRLLPSPHSSSVRG